ncbi:GNAT family N-acetyltransferase [Leptolyngbya cf. ectocarpi LEGE 11479]|uniref:GNAT family N-acetyltransferase n=1 Tax=Leptolyngbya cf. ectocarpi LEGE 11479 TaxID=1828722 RepID=A0A929FB47_LEPEC|nr:GNAT family N-acetyltransferase [Leptolyngbya ectocarpi]MBE9068709.1 GNAT family N-acetyltransferase [Leptolyngbya cf. ectocarpi LEGE 11479]
MNIRVANAGDLPTLSTLYRQTVLVNAPAYYSPAQTKVWSASISDADHFRRFILEVNTFVAIDDKAILGFAGIGDNGHVASAYVKHDCIHQGIGSVLMQSILDYAQEHHIRRLYAEASEFSLGLFKKFGFQLYDTEIVDLQDIQFERYLMERYL